MKKAHMIRQVLVELNPYVTNSEIKDFCIAEYDFKPTSQQIYEAIGSETDRQAERYNGRELQDVKKLCRRTFHGDYNRLFGAVRLVVSNAS